MNFRIKLGRWISGDQKRINSYLSNIALLQDQLSKAKDDLLKANEQFDEIAHSVQISANQEAEIEKLENKNTDLCMEVNTLKANAKTVKEQLDKSIDAEKAQQEEIKNLKAELRNVKSKNTALIRENKKLSGDRVTSGKRKSTENVKEATE